MHQVGKPSARILYRDLQIVAAALDARFPARAAEARRVEYLRELLSTGAELVRALSAHTQHGLVHCQGSHGNSDLATDTAELCNALARWSAQVHQIGVTYSNLITASMPDGDYTYDLPPARQLAE